MTTVNFMHDQENIHPHLGRGRGSEENIFAKCGNNVKMKLIALLLYSAKHEREGRDK